MGIWDDADLKTGGEFVRFEKVGDTISGVITGIRKHRFEDGSVAAQVLMTTDDGEERTLTAGQVQLKQKLAGLRPDVGDHLTVKLSQIEKRSGGKTLKHFDVQVKQGAGADDSPPF
jgi:hypothetical protein